jgi:hypothetical protein
LALQHPIVGVEDLDFDPRMGQRPDDLRLDAHGVDADRQAGLDAAAHCDERWPAVGHRKMALRVGRHRPLQQHIHGK